MSKLRADAPEWVPGKPLQGRCLPNASEVPPGLLLELPPEVMTCIMEHVGPAVRDLMSASLACKPLQAALAAAAVHLDLCVSQAAHTAAPANTNSSSHMQRGMQQVVGSLSKYTSGARSLSLSGLPAEDGDVLQLLRTLPRLQRLQLSSCRKLTSKLPRALASLWAEQQQQQQQTHCHDGRDTSITGDASQQQPDLLRQGSCWQQPLQQQQQEQLHQQDASSACASQVSTSLSSSSSSSSSSSRLACLDLQRCFQLRGPALGELLAAAARGHVALQALAFSHLDLAAWPPQPPPQYPSQLNSEAHGMGTEPAGQDASSSSAGASDHLAPMSHAELASALGLDNRAADAAARRVNARQDRCTGAASSEALSLIQCVPPAASPTTQVTMLALNNCSGLTHTALWSVAQLCPHLQFLMLGGCTLQPSTKHRAESGRLSAAAAGVAMEPAHMLASVLSTLSKLRAVELTFFPASVVDALEDALHAGSCRASREASGALLPYVWDFTRCDSVIQAVAVHQALCQHGGSHRHHSCRSNSTSDEHTKDDSSGTSSSCSSSCNRCAGLAMVLRCGANCSNGARMAPLHVAVELGDAGLLRGLLQLGAVVDAREKGGSAPLFGAAFHGHLACACALLDAGADPQLANAAGERPLYIAALRGHVGLVRLLLGACTQRGLPWQDAKLYGDAWTPLMAAAVADHYDVCSLLLRAAGPVGGREQAALVSAVNRYGQCVLHIAARKASPPLLRLLLAAAGPAPWGVCSVPDSNGDTPMDVARKNRNMSALDELSRLHHTMTGRHRTAIAVQ